MGENKNLAYYVALIGLFIFFKLVYKVAGTNDLGFLLKPTNTLVELLTASNGEYVQDFGYHYQELNIVIDKSCSGFNFWLLCFTMLSFLVIGYLKQPLMKILSLPLTMLLALGFTILANTSRIYTAIILESKIHSSLELPSHVVHEAIGVITNLSFLILIYFLIEKLIKTYYHAKLG